MLLVFVDMAVWKHHAAVLSQCIIKPLEPLSNHVKAVQRVSLIKELETFQKWEFSRLGGIIHSLARVSGKELNALVLTNLMVRGKSNLLLLRYVDAKKWLQCDLIHNFLHAHLDICRAEDCSSTTAVKCWGEMLVFQSKAGMWRSLPARTASKWVTK